MSEVNKKIYLGILQKEIDTLNSWSKTLRDSGRSSAEMDRRADNVRRSMAMVRLGL